MPAIARTLLSLSFAAALIACGGGSGDGEGSPADAGENPVTDAAPGSADAEPGDYTTLITGTWSKEPGSDSYWCTYLTVDEDVYITGLEAIAPLGTH